MPVIRHVPQDPTDLVIQGESLRSMALAWEASAMSVVWPMPVIGPIRPAPFEPVSLSKIVSGENSAFVPTNSMAFTVDGRIAADFEGRAIRANAGVACGQAGGFIPVYANECMALPIRSRPAAWSRFSITGVSRDSAGAPLGVCVVKVFRTPSDTKGWDTISDGGGAWTIADLGAEKGPFYLVEYKAGSPDRAGTSLNTLMADETQ